MSVALAATLAVPAVPATAAPLHPARTQPPAPAEPVEPRRPTQVVVFDRVERTTALVSHDEAGRPAAASSRRPSISADGAFVAFESDAAIDGDDTNRAADVYLWTRASNDLARISSGIGGAQSDGASRDPSISGNGSVVAFSSVATNLTRDSGFDGSTPQVFAWQRATGASTLVSVGAGATASGASGAPSVSLDGRVVAFESAAPGLVAGDENAARDIFLRDLARNATIRASVSVDGDEVGADSRRPSLAGDGGAVAFDSASADLTPPDTNGTRDVFVRDLPPAVQVAPTALDFGETPLGTAATQGVTVVSVGWTPVTMTSSTIAGTNAGDFVVADDGCSGQSLAYGGSCDVAVLHVPSVAGAASAELSISSSALDTPHLVALAAGVPAAQVRLDPAVGPPGIVTMLTGSNFPPGAVVTLRWDQGITQAMQPVVVGPDGRFAVGVLVFHNDRRGPRQLLVSPGPDGPPFEQRSAPFLVVAPPLEPPGTSAVTFASPDLRLVLIRR